VAAELLVPHRDDLMRRLSTLDAQLSRQMRVQLRHAMQRADRASLRLAAQRPRARLDLLCRRRDEARRRLAAALLQRIERERARLRAAGAILRAEAPGRRIARMRERLAPLEARPGAAIARRLQAEALRVRSLARSLEAISPLATVARGYAILQHPDGRIVRRTGDAAPGDRLRARLADGHLPLRVEPDDAA
jgi:exodeoxyribonuclease VII large subunit